jgi:hypothetical protein
MGAGRGAAGWAWAASPASASRMAAELEQDREFLGHSVSRGCRAAGSGCDRRSIYPSECQAANSGSHPTPIYWHRMALDMSVFFGVRGGMGGGKPLRGLPTAAQPGAQATELVAVMDRTRLCWKAATEPAHQRAGWFCWPHQHRTRAESQAPLPRKIERPDSRQNNSNGGQDGPARRIPRSPSPGAAPRRHLLKPRVQAEKISVDPLFVSRRWPLVLVDSAYLAEMNPLKPGAFSGHAGSDQVPSGGRAQLRMADGRLGSRRV